MRDSTISHLHVFKKLPNFFLNNDITVMLAIYYYTYLRKSFLVLAK